LKKKNKYPFRLPKVEYIKRPKEFQGLTVPQQKEKSKEFEGLRPSLPINVHPISVREELVLDFQVRLTPAKWRHAKQVSRITTLQKPFTEIRIGRGKKTGSYKKVKHQKFKQMFLMANNEGYFNQARIGNDVVWKGSKRKSLNMNQIVESPAFFAHDEVLFFLKLVRAWATGEGLTVGGFPLVTETKVLKETTPILYNPTAELSEGEERFGYYGLVDSFIKRFGVGQVWGQKQNMPEVIRVTLAMYGESSWQEYKNEAPRFYTKTVYINLTDEAEKGLMLSDVGVKDIYSTQGRMALLEYILMDEDLINRDSGDDFESGPLGVIGFSGLKGEE